jgi:pilus assembly protein CpaB
MSRTRFLVLAVIALTLSGAITYLTYVVLRDRVQPANETVDLVLAATELEIGAELTAEDLTVGSWPAHMPLAGVIPAEEMDTIVGRGVIYPVTINEPVLETKLAPEGAGAGLAPTIPEGMRAMSIRVNNFIGVAGFVTPGTRVDILLSGSPTGDGVEMSKVILENVTVLSAGRELDRDDPTTEAGVVTILVTPEDAQKLALANTQGRMQLALRNPLDLDLPDPARFLRTTMFDQRSGAPSTTSTPQAAPSAARTAAVPRAPLPPPQIVYVPAPEPPIKRHEVELIQGRSTETVTFDVPNE